MYPTEHYLTALPQKNIFRRMAKDINHPSLRPDLYKDLELTELDKDKWITQVCRMTQTTLIMLLMTMTYIQEWCAN